MAQVARAAWAEYDHGIILTNLELCVLEVCVTTEDIVMCNFEWYVFSIGFGTAHAHKVHM